MEEIDCVLQMTLLEDDLSAAILNTGITYFGEHLDLEWSTFEKMLQTNVKDMVRMTQQLVLYFCDTLLKICLHIFYKM